MYHSGKGYAPGRPNDFNAQYALDETQFWYFLDATQSDELENPMEEIDMVMMKQRKNEMDLYKLIASDSAFKSAMQDSFRRLLSA